jgi:catechol-2,3-dioxygenase
MTAQLRIGHVAVPAKDPRGLAEFYCRGLGLSVSMSGEIPQLGQFVFLGDRPDAPLPLLALQTNPAARHVAFEVESLAALQDWYARAKANGIAVEFALNHRCSLSLYLHDPEGNAVEVYWATGLKTDDAFVEPIALDDLEQPEPALRERVLAPA